MVLPTNMTHNEFSFQIHFTEPLKLFMSKINYMPTVAIDPIDLVTIPSEIYFDQFKQTRII